MGDVAGIGLQRGVGHCPVEGEGVAQPHDLLLVGEHPVGFHQHLPVLSHGGHHPVHVAAQPVDGEKGAAPVGERLIAAVGPKLLVAGRGHVAAAVHHIGQGDVGGQVLQVVPAVPILNGVGVAVEAGEDDSGCLHGFMV